MPDDVALPVPLDLDTFIHLPRTAGLALSPDGRRLVTLVSTVAPDGRRYGTALWEVDPAGDEPARRLTRSAQGEASPAFMPDGDVVFTSARPDPDRRPGEPGEDQPGPGLWMLPAGGGEARLVLEIPGGMDALAVARQSGTVVLAAAVTPGAGSIEEDRERAKARREAGVTALLLEHYPARYWDHWLGPRQRRLLVVDPRSLGEGGQAEPRDLTPDPGRALDQVDLDVTPDGATVVCGWRRREGRQVVTDLVAIDTATGSRRLLAGDGANHSEVRCSPDGRWAVCVREQPGQVGRASDQTLWLVSLDGEPMGPGTPGAPGSREAAGPLAGGRDLLPGFDLWPTHPVWAPDGRTIYFTADERGHCPAWKLALDSGEVTRLASQGAFSDLCPSPDGDHIYSLWSTMGSPPAVVRLDTAGADQVPVVLRSPGPALCLSSRVEELWAEADDGARIHSWLVLPPGASSSEPAPLVVFIHGGPLGSWNSWHWRWSPHVLAAQGYAVLLPDPALSTGYGQDFVQRGWGRWGERPYTDLMDAVDAALGRPDLDASRTAAMGGSFGGYMANWVAGHTDRFQAIVTHASLWALDQFHGTTDLGSWWELEFGDPYTEPERYLASSPHLAVDRIHTPMLVIHGELDHRVPLSEALRLWTDLSLHGVEAKFLYFPDENHWVQKPQNMKAWYQTVLAFLDHHVLGKEWRRPELL